MQADRKGERQTERKGGREREITERERETGKRERKRKREREREREKGKKSLKDCCVDKGKWQGISKWRYVIWGVVITPVFDRAVSNHPSLDALLISCLHLVYLSLSLSPSLSHSLYRSLSPSTPSSPSLKLVVSAPLSQLASVNTQLLKVLLTVYPVHSTAFDRLEI